MPENEEREEKPKKLFIVTHIVWEDMEIDTEISEFRKNSSGRGAPSKWRLTAKDFKNRIEETLGDAEQIAETFNEHLALSTEPDGMAIKPIQPPRGFTPNPKEIEELNEGNAKPADETPKNDTDENEDDDMDFGDFDKDAG